MAMVKRFSLNTRGRDFAVGDIHGAFSKLEVAVDRIGFDESVDRLFAVGDLVDRGPEGCMVIDWLDKPWFYSIQGNHENLLVWSHKTKDRRLHCMNGGAWFYDNPATIKDELAMRLAALPIGFEVATAQGPVGIVHADCPRQNWPDFMKDFGEDGFSTIEDLEWALTSRKRFNELDREMVGDVRAVIVGHNVVQTPLTLGNVLHIDTGGFQPDRQFTFVDLSTLNCVSA